MSSGRVSEDLLKLDAAGDAETERLLHSGATSEDSAGQWAPTPQKLYAPAPPEAGLAASINEQQGAAADELEFSTKLCDCCAGTAGAQTCLVSFFLPCIAHGIIADAASGGRGQTPPCLLYSCGAILAALFGVPNTSSCVLGTLARSKLRSKYNLKGSTFNDCCLHMWCHPCGMAQELRELRAVRERCGMGTDNLAAPAPVGSSVAAKNARADASSQVSQEQCRYKDVARDLAASYL